MYYYNVCQKKKKKKKKEFKANGIASLLILIYISII